MAPKKKINKKNLGTSFDRLLSYNLVDDETIDVCNRVLSFLSGLNYAIAGRVYQIGAESYLIASPNAFEDGSLEKWVKEFGHIDD